MQDEADPFDRNGQQEFLATADYLSSYGMTSLVPNIQRAATEVLTEYVMNSWMNRIFKPLKICVFFFFFSGILMNATDIKLSFPSKRIHRNTINFSKFKIYQKQVIPNPKGNQLYVSIDISCMVI